MHFFFYLNKKQFNSNSNNHPKYISTYFQMSPKVKLHYIPFTYYDCYTNAYKTRK